MAFFFLIGISIKLSPVLLSSNHVALPRILLSLTHSMSIPPPPHSLILLLLPLLWALLLPPLLLLSPFVSAATVTHLPGFDGPLPFHLETGYVVVDEVKEVELFYYFIQSEKNPKEDPLLLWLTGGPGCSAFSGLVFEIGPLKFRKVEYNGSLPTLEYHPYSWTKVANIIFIDSPVGTGFSFSRKPEGNNAGDMTSSLQIYKFLKKWFIDHPHFLSNPLYIAGDSYAGLIVPIIAYEVLKGIDAGDPPLLNLKGYLTGNPVAEAERAVASRIPQAHALGIISDEFFEKTVQDCLGDDYYEPHKPLCSLDLQVLNKFFKEINMAHILEPFCPEYGSPKPKFGNRRSMEQTNTDLMVPPLVPELRCRNYGYYLSYKWANSKDVREALHIQKGTVGEWQRCKNDLSSYTFDVLSSIPYHLRVTGRGYRALVYSGDHDMIAPLLSTKKWIKSLNYSIVDDWRSWYFGGQVAGYTRAYSNNLTFATVKGAGHTAPEYKPKECLAMLRRWLSQQPL